MNAKKRPSFGWLLLGTAWGMLGGHALGMYFVFPQIAWHESARWCLYTTLAGAMLGIGGGVLIDWLIQRNPIWLDWLIFVMMVLLYLFLFPAVNVAVE